MWSLVVIRTFVCVHVCVWYCTCVSLTEGANGPTTPDADKILRERKRLVVPVS